MVSIRKNYLIGTPKTKTELYNGKKIIIIHNTATPGATTYYQMVTSGFLSLALVVVFGIYQYVNSKTRHIGAKLERGDKN